MGIILANFAIIALRGVAVSQSESSKYLGDITDL